MSAYSQWPERTLPVTQVKLDPQNPRLHSPDPDIDQRAILHEMVEREDILSLARDIAQQGYFPTETILVMRDTGSRFTVLEGNRRIAALKVLLNPNLAPIDKKKRFRALAQDGAGRVPKKVRAIIAPHRVAARPLILNRHTTSGVKRWPPVAQARYIEQMVADGFSVEQIARDMSVTVDTFRRRFRDAKLYQLVSTLDLPSDVKQHLDDPTKFKVSVLQRIAESKPGREWLAMEPHDIHGYVIRAQSSDFKKALARIVTAIIEGKVTTRDLHDDSKIRSFLQHHGESRPTPKKGRPASAATVAGKSQTSRKTPQHTSPGRLTRAGNPSILSSSFECNLNVPRVHAILKELGAIRLEKFPNASAVLFRSLVDMAVGHYVDRKGITKQMKLKIGRKQSRPADWMPSLDQMLQYLVQHASESDFPIDPSARKALKRFLTDHKSQTTLNWLNGYAHNRFQIPTPDQLRSIAAILQPILELVLQEPTPTT